jgi:hypothetical protein
LIGSYIFPEDLRDPESSTCTADLSIPVDTGRPLSCQVVENDRQLRSRIAQRLNVLESTPRHLARCGLAGRPF